MYNEVKCICPVCGGSGYCQVTQYVLGFGGFNLHNPDSFNELSEAQLKRLYIDILEEDFVCLDCQHAFNPYEEHEKGLAANKRDFILNKILI